MTESGDRETNARVPVETIVEGGVTKPLKEGEIVVIGLDPKNGHDPLSRVDRYIKIEDSRLVSQLSRQAVAIKLGQRGLRVKAVTDRNTVVVWEDAQRPVPYVELRYWEPLGDPGWREFDGDQTGPRHLNIDIETANGTLVRLAPGGTHGRLVLRVNPEERMFHGFSGKDTRKIEY